MSIPPLVCSTPPPPDQCEEDKDPEDFDISYNRKYMILIDIIHEIGSQVGNYLAKEWI